MAYKEIWFVRHTETVTPESYDFDLSRQGRRHAAQLGWYLAQQEIAAPAVIFHAALQRAETMAAIIMNAVSSETWVEAFDPRVRFTLEPETRVAVAGLFHMTQRLEDLPQSHNQAVNTVIFVTHRAYAEACDFFSYLMTNKNLQGAGLKDITPTLLEDFKKQAKGYQLGECMRIRFPVRSWTDIKVGMGAIAQRTNLDAITPQFKTWHKNRQSTLQAPAQ